MSIPYYPHPNHDLVAQRLKKLKSALRGFVRCELGNEARKVKIRIVRNRLGKHGIHMNPPKRESRRMRTAFKRLEARLGLAKHQAVEEGPINGR